MDRYNRLLRAACTVLTAALMAGCTAYLTARALGFTIFWLPVYAAALYSAALAQLARRGAVWSVGAAAAILTPAAFLLAARMDDIASALRAAIQSAPDGGLAAHASAGESVALVVALLLGALFALLLRVNSRAPFSLLVLLAALICALAVNEDISLWAALPGIIAGVAAFGLPGDARTEGVRPVLLIPAIVLSLLALLLSPAARTTWEPLENLAERIRSITRDYIRFTEERLAFTINEKGYDHAGMIGDDVVAMLGGPADPTEDAVMRVETDSNLLLRGTIKRSYTGYSWVDDQAKARYLYYDFTHAGVRRAVFDANTAAKQDGFVLREASVEMLENGTSTLFVPGQMAQFEMGLEDAVYYNSAGELFLTREVEPGDSYAFSARVPESDAALIAACAQRANMTDDPYAAMQQDYTALPDGIDSRVYALAVELTKNSVNAAEKAFAIQNYLVQNYRYTLDGSYPEPGRDFVSWFLLEEKQGYCSYFASSMAVLCRIVGLPARYVEGYYVPANPDGATIITGRNAHAWVEVYLNGLGWIAFDPTARTVENSRSEGEAPNGGGMDNSGVMDEFAQGDTPGESDAPEPTPTPTPAPDDGEDAADGAPTPTPEPDGSPQTEDNIPNPPDGQNIPENENNEQKNRSHAWLWVLLILILLALIALAALWVRKRLSDTDPLKLCATARGANQAAMILYRGILTLLLQIGLAPANGETPQAFARRAVASIPNPAYERFVSAVACSRYSGRNVGRDALDDGREAYQVFLNGMRRSERLRYTLRRVLHGLGSFESIP